MEFPQATRYIFPLFKVFAIIPFDITGLPGHRNIQRNRKWFIFGNLIMACALCSLFYNLMIFSKISNLLADYVFLSALVMFTITVLSEMISSLVYQHKYIYFYQKLIRISDSNPNYSKYFTIIFYYFIFKIVFIIINVICDIYLFSNEYYINLLIPEFLYLPAQIYHSVFISQLHLILISTICVLKAINDNLLLLNFIHNDFVTFKKLFNMFQEIISISELNLYMTQFVLHN